VVEKRVPILFPLKLHYVPVVSSNVIWRSTSWMLSTSGMFFAIIGVGLPFLLWLGQLGASEDMRSFLFFLLVLPIVMLPRASQWFRTIQYYGLPFSTIKQKREIAAPATPLVSLQASTTDSPFCPKPQWEFPRLCRGGSKSLTDTAAPSTKLRIASRQAHEEGFD
jgi:hypothetical protein